MRKGGVGVLPDFAEVERCSDELHSAKLQLAAALHKFRTNFQ